MELKELLRELHIDKEPIENENGSYTIDLDNSNEFARYYSKLDKAEFLEEDEEASQVTANTRSIQFVNDEYTITLIGNFDTDEYKMIIRKM